MLLLILGVTGKIVSGPVPSEKATDQSEIVNLWSHNSQVQQDMCQIFFKNSLHPTNQLFMLLLFGA